MRNLMVMFAVALLLVVSSCTQRTCPTYTRGIDKAPQEQPEQKVQKDQENA